jgi:hypothetical protein
MYNISTSLIAFRLEENDKIIYQGSLPYDLLSYICYSLPNGDLNRKLIYLIEGEEFTYQHNFTSRDSTYQELLSLENWWWNWKEAIADELAKGRDEASRLLREQQDSEAQALQNQMMQNTAEDAFRQYQQMVIEQKQLTEEQVRLLEAEKLRQDENRIALVRGVALDPSLAVSALESEFGQNGDIRRQVAAVMERDIAISRQVIRMPASYWTSSYEIMEVIGLQVSIDHTFAQEVSDRLPDNSSLKTTMKSFGWTT